MTPQEAYNVLGLNSKHTPQDVRKVFKKLAFKHHPDQGGDSEKFSRLKEAYDLLSNPPKQSNSHWSSVFEAVFNGSKAPFQRRTGPTPVISVPLERVFSGTIIQGSYPLPDICAPCNGSGAVGDDCSYCKGTGRSNGHTRSMHFVASQECHYCNGTGKMQLCGECKGTGWSKSDQEIYLKIPPTLSENFVVPNKKYSKTSCHRYIKIRSILPEKTRISQNKLIYEPDVDLVDIIKGTTLTLLGKDIKIPPFSFGTISVNNIIFVVPQIKVEDPSLFQSIVNNE